MVVWHVKIYVLHDSSLEKRMFAYVASNHCNTANLEVGMFQWTRDLSTSIEPIGVCPLSLYIWQHKLRMSDFINRLRWILPTQNVIGLWLDKRKLSMYLTYIRVSNEWTKYTFFVTTNHFLLLKSKNEGRYKHP